MRRNNAAGQKYLDNGEMQLWLISVMVVKKYLFPLIMSILDTVLQLLK